MNIPEVTVVEIIDDSRRLGIVELVACACVERSLVIEMVDVGLLEPVGETIEQWQFAGRDLRRLRAAQRMIADLGVNLAGAVLVLDLIEQRDELAARVQMLETMLSEPKQSS